MIADSDESLYSLAEQAGASAWGIESCRDAAHVRDRLSESTPHLILLDDEAVRPDDRGWLLERIRLQAPRTFVIYVAARHDAETEKRARAHGVHYYMSKPVDPNRIIQVSQAFIKAASRISGSG
ncbi:MAG: response regulator [Candidatus Binataceae bacterium]